MTLVAADGAAAGRAVGIQQQLRRLADRISAVDVLVAGVALARDVPVVTRNVSEFARTSVQVSPY